MFKKDGLADQVMASEIYFATFVAEHNIPFLQADHFTKLCKSMFPDSKIAQQFACSRTKTTDILRRHYHQHLVMKLFKLVALHVLPFYVMVVMTKVTKNTLE